MKLDSELRTLLYLEKSLKNDFSLSKTLTALKLIMATLIMVCVVSLIFVVSDKLSALITIPLVAVCGLFISYISYYIHSVEIWPHYVPLISKESIRKRINEIN